MREIIHDYLFQKDMSLNRPTIELVEKPTKGRKKTSGDNDKFNFDADGGVVRLKFKVDPKDSKPYLEVSSNFVSPSIEGDEIVLKVEKNLFSTERNCSVKFMNSFNPIDSFYKIIRQEGRKRENAVEK